MSLHRKYVHKLTICVDGQIGMIPQYILLSLISLVILNTANLFRFDGVSSLYGSNLAINHVLYDTMIEYKTKYNIDINEWKTKKLDCWSDQPIQETVQLHVVIGKHTILKDISEIRTTQKLSDLCSDYEKIQLRSFEPIETATLAFEYASRIVGHSLRDVCSLLQVPFGR